MPSRTLVGPAGVKASAHPSNFAPGPLGRPTLGLLLPAAGCWLAGDRGLGPTCCSQHRARPTNQPGSVPRARFYFGRLTISFVF